MLSFVFLATLLAGALGIIGTAQAILFTGNTNTSSPTTIDTFLTYTGASVDGSALSRPRATSFLSRVRNGRPVKSIRTAFERAIEKAVIEDIARFRTYVH